EGSKEILSVACKNFERLALNNIHALPGNFDTVLPGLVARMTSPIDLAFIDGNHRLQPTVQYFDTIVNKANNFSLVILDDIHWSREMEQAWEYCKGHSAVTLSIDLFFIGILIFRREILEKQHFTIRF